MQTRIVLNVDDDAPTRFLRTRILERAGYGVAEAGSAAAALSRSKDASVVLLDVRLPDMDGFEVCQAFKKEAPSTPVVMITSVYRTAQARRDAIDAGADAFLLEPVDPNQLVRVIDRVVQGERPLPEAEEDVWIVTDAVGTIQDISPAGAKMLNLSVRGARGRSLPAYFVENRPRLLQDILRAADGTIVERVSTLQPRDRRPRRVRMDLSSQPHSGGADIRWVLSDEPV